MITIIVRDGIPAIVGCEGFSEDLYTVVSEVYDNNSPFGRYSNSGGTIHLAGLDAGLTERAQKCPVRTENLYPMIPRIRHDDMTLGVHSDSLWSSEFPIAVALVAEELGAVEVGANHHDPVIVEVCHYHVACDGKK